MVSAASFFLGAVNRVEPAVTAAPRSRAQNPPAALLGPPAVRYLSPLLAVATEQPRRSLVPDNCNLWADARRRGENERYGIIRPCSPYNSKCRQLSVAPAGCLLATCQPERPTRRPSVLALLPVILPRRPSDFPVFPVCPWTEAGGRGRL